jgi:flagellar biogenesis protein FliO
MEQIEEFSKIFRVIGFLGVLAGVAFFLNRFVSSRRKSFNSLKKNGISISETKSLGNKQFLVVAEYGGESFLIGISPSQIQFLSKVNSLSKDPKDQ